MDFTNLGSLLFSSAGRINRGRYWSAVLIYILIMILLVAVGFIMLGNSLLELAGEDDAGDLLAGFASKGIGYALIVLVVYIPVLISSVMVGIKRLHDRDKSGWWLLLFYLAPAVLNFAHLGWVGGLASFALSIWAFVELGCLRGTAGPNKYGPDPLTTST